MTHSTPATPKIHRVRAAGLLVEANRLLLVREGTLPNGEPFFVPPGGGLELTDLSLTRCLEREVFEETGLHVAVADPVYIKEHVDLHTQTHHVEIFFRIHRRTDLPASTAPTGDREHFWFTRQELADKTIFPLDLKTTFWTNPSTPCQYLGRTQA